MGSAVITDLLAQGASKRQALAYHLECNHYPPVPASMLPVCQKAIDLASSGDWETRLDLPEGTTYRGRDDAPVWAVVEAHHLEPFLAEPHTCPECGRVFDLADPDDAAELAYGHDCEV